jgi:hypothetical protein
VCMQAVPTLAWTLKIARSAWSHDLVLVGLCGMLAHVPAGFREAVGTGRGCCRT